jgi:hypothetical protein
MTEHVNAQNPFAKFTYSDLDMNAKYGPDFYENYTPFAH